MVGPLPDFALWFQPGAKANFAGHPVCAMNICRKLLLITGTGLFTLFLFIGAALADGTVVAGFFLSEPQGGRDLGREHLAAVNPPRIPVGSNCDFVEFPNGYRPVKTTVEAVTGEVVLTIGLTRSNAIALRWSPSGPDFNEVGADVDAYLEAIPTVWLG